MVSFLVGVVAIAGIGAVLAGTLPAASAGNPGRDLVAAAQSSPSPSIGPTTAPAVSRSPVPTSTPARTPTPTSTPQPTAPPISALTGYQWPLPHGRLTLPFGPSPWGSRIVAGEKFHDGADMATFCGDRIVAAHDGTVLVASRRFDGFIGWLGDLTPYTKRLDEKNLWSTLPIVVIVDDGNGYRSIYAHFSKVAVKMGDIVAAGDFLGFEGMTGRASGCHLHYGLFSPLETATFGLDPVVVKRMKLPDTQIARIDPLLVLPPRPQDQPSASPSAASASPSAASASPGFAASPALAASPSPSPTNPSAPVVVNPYP